jgi:hypothetical protein
MRPRSSVGQSETRILRKDIDRTLMGDFCTIKLLYYSGLAEACWCHWWQKTQLRIEPVCMELDTQRICLRVFYLERFSCELVLGYTENNCYCTYARSFLVPLMNC